MKRNRFTCLVIFVASLFSLKTVNCDNELSNEQGNKTTLKVTVILPIYEQSYSNSGKCSLKYSADALQNVEALYYALDQIEKNVTLSQKFNLKVDVMEDCNFPGPEFKCVSNLYDQLMVNRIDNENATFGLIYDTVSTTFNYENIFDTFRTFPHISYSGPPTKLNDADVIAPQFTYDFITSTSGHIFIADVILEILNHFKWKYVTVHDPYTDDRHNKNEITKFFKSRVEELVKSNDDVCIGESSTEPRKSHSHTNSTAEVIICYCNQEEIQKLEHQLRVQNRSKKYVVIAGHTEPIWTKKVKWNSTLGDLYYVTPSLQYNENFHNYYTSLSEKNYTKYPYLKDFRKRYFDCFKTNGNEKPNGTHRDFYQNNSNAAINIIKSLYAMAHVVNQTVDSIPIASIFAGKALRGIEFELFNEKVSFTGRSGLPRVEKFDVHKFQATQNEFGNFTRVAQYLKTNHTEYALKENRNSQIRGSLTILDARFKYPKNHPMQRCSEPCPAGYSKINPDDNQCCWKCEKCDILSILHEDGKKCDKCGEGLMANQNYTECISSTLSVVLQISTECAYVQNLLSIGLSSFSIILTAIVLFVFVKYQNTPAVKSTTRELCYMMFAGIILVNTTLLISTATSNFETSDVKVLPALGFTMIYAALLVKTNRIARLLVTSKHRFANMNLKYLSLKAQIIITTILIAIEILICWFAVKFQDLSEPGLKRFYLDKVFLIKIFAFVALLILFCTYYAIKTRNLPENFNESKYIGFAMYATLLTATAFSIVYFTIDDKKILAMNVCASINTLIILIFLFTPKLYIILWKPERNTSVYFSPVTSNIRSYIGKESRSKSHKPLNQCYSLENKEKELSTPDDSKEQVHDTVANVIKHLNDILEKASNANAQKNKEMAQKYDSATERTDGIWEKEYVKMIAEVKSCYAELSRMQKDYA